MTDEPTRPPSFHSRRRGLAIGLGVAAAFVLLAVGARLFVLTEPGRAMVADFWDNRSLGGIGRLHVKGLHGDVLSKFSLDEATITDAKGVWLDIRDLKVDWSPLALAARDLRIQALSARTVAVLHRPQIAPQTHAPSKMPVSVDIGRFTTDVELAPAFSQTYGRWAAAGAVDLKRSGRKHGAVEAHSLTRPGDFLTLNFDIGGHDRMRFLLEASEAKGGPVAGALGYATDQPFAADIKADGAGSRGDFYATLTSGSFTPLSANGRWTDKGGEAQGLVAFAGSNLLKPVAERLGLQARFQTQFQRRPDRRYDVSWTIATDNLASQGQGTIDANRLGSTSGLRMRFSTASLSKLAGRPVAGPARFDGLWTGSAADWTLKGALALQSAQADGYALASVAGPVQIHDLAGRIDAKGALQGAGGAGKGLIAELLGGRPKATLDASRLADGRMILNRVDLDGADLVARGQGSRGLTGGFAFAGTLDIPRIAALHPGGRGGLSARWRAADAGPRRPWTIAISAGGKGFATGMGQLDRLLGAEPKLEAAGLYDHGVVRLERTHLAGKAGQANGTGSVGLGGKLDLKLDWTAQGPFEAGPVVIAGNAKGSGALTGTFAQPKADLVSTFQRIDLPDLTLTDARVALTFARDPKGYDGTIDVLAASAYGPAKANSRFAFTRAGLQLDQLALDAGGVKANGSVGLNRGQPSNADLTFAAGPGAFLTAGAAQGRVRLTDAAQTQAVIDVAGSNLAFRNSPYVVHTLKLDGRGTLANLPFTLQTDVGGAFPASFNGTGVYARAGGGQSIALSGSGKAHGAAWRTLQPLRISFARDRKAIEADLGVGKGRMTFVAHQTGAALDAKATLAKFDMAAIDGRLLGEVNGGLSVQGRGSELEGALEAHLANVRDTDAPETGAINGEIRGRLASSRLHLTASATDAGGGTGTADVDLPVAASAEPLHLGIARTQPISGRFQVAGEARPYWDLFVGGEDSLSGKIAAQGTIAGTLKSPQITGSASTQNARFEESRSGLDLRNLTLAADFNHDTAVFKTFTANDGKGGNVTGQGQVDLAPGGASSFTLKLNRFQLIDNDMGSAKASGPVTVTRGADGKVKIVGNLRINRAQINPKPPVPNGVVRMDVVEINRPANRGGHYTPPQTGPAIALDVTLRAPGQVLVQGRGLNAELALDAHVGGTTREPELTGQATVTHGDFSFAGKRFQLDPGGTIDLSTQVNDIRLAMQAVYNAPTGGMTAYVNVSGTAAHPRIRMTSSPAMPEDEILSQIVFGASASQLSTAQAAQIGAATASLAGGGGFDVLGNLKELAGLDVLSFGAEASSFTVTGGKYVGNNLYLEVVGGGKNGTAVQADWRVIKSLSIISQFSGTGYSKLSVYWRKDFH